MADLKGFRKVNNITQDELSEYLGDIGKAFISQIEHGTRPLPVKHLAKLLCNDKGWDTTPLERKVIEYAPNISIENSDIHGNSAPVIDARVYHSDSPDILRAQIDSLDRQMREKMQIWEARIKEKDAQIKEKDAQINRLLDILQGKH